MEIGELLLRMAISFVTLFATTRMMGRKEISEITFFNFTSAIAIGSIAASLVYSPTFTLRNGIIALVGWGIFTIVVSIIEIKFKKARLVTNGEPIIVIKDGMIMENSLRKTMLDMDTLNSLLRQKDVFSIKDVDYAIFETSGRLSVMKKESKQPVTKGDIQLIGKKKLYPTTAEVISDGVVNKNNLQRLNVNEDWLMKELEKSGIGNVSEVFYAEMQQDGSLYIDRKDNPMIH